MTDVRSVRFRTQIVRIRTPSYKHKKRFQPHNKTLTLLARFL